MPPTQTLPNRATALLLTLTAALLLFRAGALPLLGPDEPRYVRVAVEMHRASEWVRPTLQGRPWLEKPPLYYWLAGAAFHVLGETETAARLPSILSAILLVGATAFLGARLLGTAAGLHAGFVLATAVLPFAYGLAASMDMLLATTVTWGIGLLGLRLCQVSGSGVLPVAYACLGLATLAKGPLGLVLPILVIGGFAAFAKEPSLLGRVVSPVAILVLLVIAAPWYAAMIADQGRLFVDDFLLGHNLQRFTSTVHNHPGAFWYYIPVLLAGLFPWTGLAVPALAGIRPGRSRIDLFLAVWLFLPLVFFSAAGSKLPGYILPCLPPLALLIGRASTDLAEGRLSLALRRSAALLGLVLGIGLVLAPFVLARQGDPAWTTLLPAGAWSLAVAWLFARTDAPNGAAALAHLRVGGAGLLVLLAIASPPILARRESGRDLFRPAGGQEVLAFGAWRTAWMAGYFYNDGNVREVTEERAIMDAAIQGPVLVVCGPAERRRFERAPGLLVATLARGPRGNALLKIAVRAPGSASSS